MGQRSRKSAHYNKGIWKKRNARYYDDPKPRIVYSPEATAGFTSIRGAGLSKNQRRKLARSATDEDYAIALQPGKFCTPTCGCHHHKHRLPRNVPSTG